MQKRAPCREARVDTHIHTHKSLFTHTQQLPGRPAEETNTGKEETRGALPVSQQGEVATSILRDPARGLFLGGGGVVENRGCRSTDAGFE